MNQTLDNNADGADGEFGRALKNTEVKSPKTAKEKTQVVSFRLSPKAHEKMTQQAASARLSSRAWLEKAILESRTRIVTNPDLAPLKFHAAKAGNNLNQLARHFNTLRLEGRLSAADCTAALDALLSIRDEFRQANARARTY